MDDKQILNLLNGFTASGIAELELEQSDLRLCLRRFPHQHDFAPPPPATIHAHAPSMGPSQPEHPVAKPHAEGQKTQAAAPGAENIPSPIVATFYRSPGPDSPAFVEVGKKVKAGQTLCILEAMKNMNELPAEFDCEILRVLPENGALVEYGQPLFEVRRV